MIISYFYPLHYFTFNAQIAQTMTYCFNNYYLFAINAPMTICYFDISAFINPNCESELLFAIHYQLHSIDFVRIASFLQLTDQFYVQPLLNSFHSIFMEIISSLQSAIPSLLPSLPYQKHLTN